MWGLTSLLSRTSAVAFLASQRAAVVQTSHYSSTTALGASTQFLLHYDYIPDVLEKRGPYREGHLGLAQKLIEEGKCLSGGPTGEVNAEIPSGALFVFTELEAAKHFVENDPYVSGDIITGHKIEQYTVVVQKE